jgi:hypothetical protein
MARKLLNVCVALALLMGCWGSVLAAAACSHVGCDAMASAPDIAAGHGAHADSHGQNVTGPEGHSCHVTSHRARAAKPSLRVQHQISQDELQSVASKQREQFCAHCVGRPEAPPAPCIEWQSYSSKKGVDFAAPHAIAQFETTAPVFLRKITPAQHAPPGKSDRHLLLNVFRI